LRIGIKTIKRKRICCVQVTYLF